MSNSPDLLYPEEYQPSDHYLSADAVENLELRYIAMLICPYNTEFALNILSHLETDVRVIRYRQDILEDFIRIPQLEQQLNKALHTIYENTRTVFAKAGSVQSFFELNENIRNLEEFIACMAECSRFADENAGRIKSAGIQRILSEIKSRAGSEDFRKFTEEVSKLKEVINSEIQSVTFGINLDKLMRPTEIMLLSVSKEPLGRATLFERLTKRDKKAEPVSEIYTRKCKDGSIDAVNKTLFSELDKLGAGYIRQFNTAMDLCYRLNTEYLVRLAPQIDFYVGAKELIDRLSRTGLTMCRPEIIDMKERRFVCRGMYDPVLSNKLAGAQFRDGGKAVVFTNDCTMDDTARILLVTGTNNGGKTTYARGAAVNQLLGQAGLWVCAEYAEISPCDGIFVHFPKEEEAGVNTSRFTEECKQFRSMVSTATESSLIFMNESLSSTNPGDCLTIGLELMKIFADMGCRLIFTTHILELVRSIDVINSANPRSRLQSLTAECDEQGEPTYRITSGMPDFSRNAEYIFRKYGISFSEYLSRKHQ